METNFSEPVIFHKVNQLYVLTHIRVLRFPKISRYSLGTKIESTVLNIMESLYFAQSKRGSSRFLILNKADVQLMMLTAHLRLAHTTHCLNDAGFAKLSTSVVEIGRMIGGWLKTTKAHDDKS